MHDLRFAGQILALLKEQLGQPPRPGKVSVNVVLSPFTHVTRESLLSALNILAEKEGFTNVRLNVETGFAEIKCKQCAAITRITRPVTQCPACGWGDFEIENPQELVVRSIEIE